MTPPRRRPSVPRRKREPRRKRIAIPSNESMRERNTGRTYVGQTRRQVKPLAFRKRITTATTTITMFTLAPFAPMLVQCVQARIGGVRPFILEKTEDREDEESEDEDETRELESKDN